MKGLMLLVSSGISSCANLACIVRFTHITINAGTEDTLGLEMATRSERRVSPFLAFSKVDNGLHISQLAKGRLRCCSVADAYNDTKCTKVSL
ncbi:hypothetical protein J3E69DRAFT_341542 [Trichoderma sp. SZMC 28015]